MSTILPFDTFEKFFSCFSSHMIEYKGVLYPTCEHAYHCQRYSDPKIIDEILNARSARMAWEVSQKYKSMQLPDFGDRKIAVMEELFRAKIAQHPDVRQALIDSGDEEIVKNQASDAFWGTGEYGNGRNEMGKLWMKLRAEL